MTPFKIVPTVGVGPLRFGMTREEVRRVMGNPDSIERDDGDGSYGREHWSYEVAGIEATFAEEWGWLLESVEAIKPTVELNGSRLVGLTESQLYDRAPAGEITLEWEGAGLREHLWDTAGSTFWVEHGRVRTLSAGPRWDEDGTLPLWPAANDD